MDLLAEKIVFGSLGNYKRWAADGWNHDDSDTVHTWTDGHVSSLVFLLDRGGRDRVLRMEVVPQLRDGVPQQMFVFANGLFCGFISIDTGGEFALRLDQQVFRTGKNIISFVVPLAFSPKKCGLGTDDRVLSTAFRWLVLET